MTKGEKAAVRLFAERLKKEMAKRLDAYGYNRWEFQRELDEVVDVLLEQTQKEVGRK